MSWSKRVLLILLMLQLLWIQQWISVSLQDCLKKAQQIFEQAGKVWILKYFMGVHNLMLFCCGADLGTAQGCLVGLPATITSLYIVHPYWWKMQVWHQKWIMARDSPWLWKQNFFSIVLFLHTYSAVSTSTSSGKFLKFFVWEWMYSNFHYRFV